MECAAKSLIFNQQKNDLHERKLYTFHYKSVRPMPTVILGPYKGNGCHYHPASATVVRKNVFLILLALLVCDLAYVTLSYSFDLIIAER